MTTLTDPRTGLTRADVLPAGRTEITRAVQRARAAQPAWAALPCAERARRLLELADFIAASETAYLTGECASTGKPLPEARAELAAAIDVIRFFAGAARAGLTPAAGTKLIERESWVRWEPLGVVGVILPFNYPLLMAAWRAAPALACGNTVVLKPAETTPDTARMFTAQADMALGPDVAQTLPGDDETGHLLAADTVDAIAFTGSLAAAKSVLTTAGPGKRLSLELGGNGPALVLPDAPPHTYDAIVTACLYNAGQSCAAPARVITLKTNYHDTVDQLASEARARRAGRDFGPLNNPAQADRFDRLVAATAAKTIHTTGMELAGSEHGGYWRQGVVAADLPDDDPLIISEVFGPLVTVQAADDLDDMLRLANGTPQALAGSVWTRDAAAALRLASRVDAGEVWVNCHLEQTPELPHGGRRASGHGTDLSVLALAEYQRPKTVTVRTV